MADHYVDVVNEKDEVIGRDLKSRRLDGFISRVVVILVMDSDGKVIVGKRALHKRFDANQYDLICGNVNSGEDYHEAAARELKEELGMECPLVMLDKYYLENVHDGKKVRIFCAAFLGHSDEEPQLNHELASFRRMSLAEIESGMAERPQEFTQGFMKEFGRLKSKLPGVASNPKIILATKSPYRQEAFRSLGFDFIADGSNVEERFQDRPEDPEDLVKHLSKAKADAVAKRHTEGIVVGFDSIGWFHGKILEKPGSREMAFQRLRMLSGKNYQFFTGIFMKDISSGKTLQRISRSEVFMRELEDSEINKYLDQDTRYTTYAHGYDPQIRYYSSTFIKKIEGSYNDVLAGIPLETIVEMLKEIGYKI